MGLNLEISYPGTIKGTTKNLKCGVKGTGRRNSKGTLKTTQLMKIITNRRAKGPSFCIWERRMRQIQV